MRCACVDIGTNTTRLLVAERDGAALREVAAVRRFLRLTPASDGTLPPATVRELAQVVAAHVQVARDHGASQVHAVATAAIRAAPNRAALCGAIHAASGIEVEVLTDAREAQLAFAGATAGLDDDRVLGVVDVGGGSSELVVGTVRDGVTWWASFPIGSGVLVDRHLHDDPPTGDQIDAARAAVAAALAGLRPPLPQAALAVGGSATSLQRITGGELTPATLARALAALTAYPAAEAARRVGLHELRARLLPAGLVLLEAAWAAFGGVPLRVAGGGLREGVILRALAGSS